MAAGETDAARWARRLDTSGVAARTAARRLAAASFWYTWLRRYGRAAVTPFEDLNRPAVDPDTSSTPGLIRDQALTLLVAADSGPRRSVCPHLGPSRGDAVHWRPGQ